MHASKMLHAVCPTDIAMSIAFWPAQSAFAQTPVTVAEWHATFATATGSCSPTKIAVNLTPALPICFAVNLASMLPPLGPQSPLHIYVGRVALKSTVDSEEITKLRS